MGRRKKEPTEVIRIPKSKTPMVKSILTMGIEGWCNDMTKQGICFLCGKRFKGKDKCNCGKESCCKTKTIHPMPSDLNCPIPNTDYGNPSERRKDRTKTGKEII